MKDGYFHHKNVSNVTFVRQNRKEMVHMSDQDVNTGRKSPSVSTVGGLACVDQDAKTTEEERHLV